MVEERQDELYHYGVKGMKWGVRRDAQLLANHRRNVDVRQARLNYRTGKITKEQKSEAIRRANAKKKKFLTDTKNEYESATSLSKKSQMEQDIVRKTAKEVPRASIKKGASLANRLISAWQIGQGLGTAAALASVPGGAVLGAAVLAGTAAGAAGRAWLIDKGIDKLA